MTVLGDGLSVGLHVALLEIIRKLVEVLVVREEYVSLSAYMRPSLSVHAKDEKKGEP